MAGLLGVAALPLAGAAAAREAGPARPANPAAAKPPQARPAARPALASRPAPRRPRLVSAAVPPDGQAEFLPVGYGAPLAEAGPSPRAACLSAARRAEEVHGLPEGLMVAIALSESGLHAHALNIRGRAHFPEDLATARALLARSGGQAMAGCVQVNAGVHARGSDWPLDAARATDWAAGMLARWHAETGSWTAALARWHGGSPAGTRRVICRVRAKLEVTAPGSGILQEAGCAGGETARVRRSGATMLEIAEAQ